MTTVQVRPARETEIQAFGDLQPTVRVRLPQERLGQNGILRFVPGADDLGELEAAFGFVDELPFIVMRYDYREKGEYTVLVDSEKATAARKDPWELSRGLLAALGVKPEQAILWENEELRELLSQRVAIPAEA